LKKIGGGRSYVKTSSISRGRKKMEVAISRGGNNVVAAFY